MSNDDYKLLYTLLVEQIEDNQRVFGTAQYRGYPAGQAMAELLSYTDGLVEGLGE